MQQWTYKMKLEYFSCRTRPTAENCSLYSTRYADTSFWAELHEEFKNRFKNK